jgi:hypothetical protein
VTVLTDVLGEILTSLDLVVLERLPEGVLLRLGPGRAPEWFEQVAGPMADPGAGTLAEALPFVGHFLTDAEAFWREGRDGRLRSETFDVQDPSGGAIGLVASALLAAGRRFIVLERPADFEDRHRVLQEAREQALAHEAHVRRTGELLEPLDEASRLVAQLAKTSLSAEQQPLADALGAQLASLVRAVEALAPLPKGVARRRRG